MSEQTRVDDTFTALASMASTRGTRTNNNKSFTQHDKCPLTHTTRARREHGSSLTLARVQTYIVGTVPWLASP